MMRVSFLFLFLLACVTGAVAQQGERLLEKPLPQWWNDGEFFDQTLPPNDKWWQNFDDPVLDSLITAAQENNFSVLGAMENIRKAKAAWRIAQSNMFPTLDMNIGWQRAKTSGNIAQSMYSENWEG